jgi:hypothetical protein
MTLNLSHTQKKAKKKKFEEKIKKEIATLICNYNINLL